MDIEDLLGFNEFQPLIDFKNMMNINGSTLFDVQQRLMSDWLESEFAGENPTDPILINEWEQVLYNRYREVCVGDTLYQFRLDAIVKIPVRKINQWINLRRQNLSFLEQVNWISIDDYIPKGGQIEHNQSEVMFTCVANGVLTASDMPGIISENDHSTWFVTGKTGFWGDNRLESKLTNYAYHKTKPNGKKVFKKIRRSCCIITTDQTFFKKHFRGFISNTYLGTDVIHITETLPDSVMQKQAYGRSSVFIIPTQPTHITSHYKRGGYQNVILNLAIDGMEKEIAVTLQEKH